MPGTATPLSMPTIYRKTPKGQTEIETRAHRLAPRLRSLLIMVDGRRSDVDLERLMPQLSAAALLSLAAGGFIEAISVTSAEPRPQPAAVTPPPVPVSSAAPALAPQPPAPPPAANAPMPAWPSRTDIFDGREPPTLPLPIPAPVSASHLIPGEDRAMAPWLVHQRQEAVHALLDLCGPMAEPLAMRMEQARTHEALSQLLDLAIQLVANTRGRQQAVAYGTRFKGG